MGSPPLGRDLALGTAAVGADLARPTAQHTLDRSVPRRWSPHVLRRHPSEGASPPSLTLLPGDRRSASPGQAGSHLVGGARRAPL